MRAVVYRGPFEVAVENVPDPAIQHPNDVIVGITSSCICGSDLHLYEGRTAAQPGIVFGHENMGGNEDVCSVDGWPNNKNKNGEFVPTTLLQPGKFNSPHGMAVDSQGNLLIAEWLIGGRFTKLDKV